jgi:ATP-dependent exoDNAse (exonuclease V) beta subunit
VQASTKRKTHAALEVNYRSSKALVLAQQVLAKRLAALGEPGIELLDGVKARDGAPAGPLPGTTVKAPVLIVDAPGISGVEPYVIAELAQRLKERREAHPDETAAVLVRTWQMATWAAETLREHGIAAQLTGDRALLQSRVAVDLRVLLAALLDTTDDIALAGLLKHPSIGLTDRGLLLLRTGGGYGRLFDPAVDLGVLDAGDRAPLEAALPLLREGRRRLGRESTAGVLEWLIAELHWRPLIAAGPEGERGEGLAQLDILLDLVRGWEADRVDPVAVARQLAEGGSEDDLPVVQLQHGPQVVAVTTVFAAKGREFDHVALLETQKCGSDGITEGHCFRLGHPQGRTLFGVHVDPLQGLTRRRDPIAVLACRQGTLEGRAEGLRLFYVGFTRAKLSVTFGIGKARIGKARADNLAQPLREVFVDNDELRGAVAVLDPDDAKVRERQRPQRPRTRRLRPFEAQWAKPDGYVLARATALDEAGLDTAAIVDDFRARAKVVAGPAAPKLPVLPAYADVDEIVWGDVVHGWLDRWRFAGTPTTAEAQAYLQDRWRSDEAAIAKWLVALGLHLRDQLPGFADLLKHTLHFEWPLVGIDGKAIFRGRTDLVVELPGREVVIIDFKAGGHVATAKDIPGLKEYAPQLEAYRRMLEGAGYKVRESGLVYVRGPSWARTSYV